MSCATCNNYTSEVTDQLATVRTGLVGLVGLWFLVLLGYLEIKTKLEARALQMLLVKEIGKEKQVMMINVAQISLMILLLCAKIINPELQAVSLYILCAKLIQTRRCLLVVDLGGILATLVFAFFMPAQSSFSSLELLDSCVRLLTMRVFPLVSGCLFMLILPLLIPIALLIVLFYVGRAAGRLLAGVRRRFPEDFDFLITMAILILATKILRRELATCAELQATSTALQHQHHQQQLIRRPWCGRPAAPSSAADNSYSLTAAGSWDGVAETTGTSSGRGRHYAIVQINEEKGYFKDIKDLPKLENQSVLEFYRDIFTNYRTIGVLSSRPVEGGCLVRLATPPTSHGFWGTVDKVLYQVFVAASWILPASLQEQLSVFGLKTATLLVQSDPSDCAQFTNRILLDKYP